jgi:hypothetical protein
VIQPSLQINLPKKTNAQLKDHQGKSVATNIACSNGSETQAHLATEHKSKHFF